jgi:hypothetical protein
MGGPGSGIPFPAQAARGLPRFQSFEVATGRSEASKELALLRAVVAALGERASPPWWRTQFLTDAGLRAVSRIFPRTAAAAAVRAASIAACAEHGRLTGAGNRYHLFRLPPDIEQAIDANLSDPASDAALSVLLKESTDALLRQLEGLAGDRVPKGGEGPISIGASDHLRTGRAVSEFAAHYAAAFSQGHRRFPYLERSEGQK